MTVPDANVAPEAVKSIVSDIGSLGEELVADWLETQGWAVLHRRWRCRWGEIDLVAQQLITPSCQSQGVAQASLAFIEVKTRRPGNWDADGLLAITPRKQAKLWKTAEMFLADHAALANLPCRFDVALVCFQRSQSVSERESQSVLRGKLPEIARIAASQMPASPLLGRVVQFGKYQLTLQNYIESAFYR